MPFGFNLYVNFCQNDLLEQAGGLKHEIKAPASDGDTFLAL